MCPGQPVTFVFSRRIFQWASCVRPTESRPDLHSSSTAPLSFAKSPSAHLREQHYALHQIDSAADRCFLEATYALALSFRQS